MKYFITLLFYYYKAGCDSIHFAVYLSITFVSHINSTNEVQNHKKYWAKVLCL